MSQEQVHPAFTQTTTQVQPSSSSSITCISATKVLHRFIFFLPPRAFGTSAISHLVSGFDLAHWAEGYRHMAGKGVPARPSTITGSSIPIQTATGSCYRRAAFFKTFAMASLGLVTDVAILSVPSRTSRSADERGMRCVCADFVWLLVASAQVVVA